MGTSKGERKRRNRQNSDYSLSETSRIRFALSKYRERMGLSYQSLLNDINNVVYSDDTGVITDRQIVREFIGGAEQEDPKIDAYLMFLQAVAPKSVSQYGDDEYADGVAQRLFDFAFPLSEEPQQDKKILNRDIGEWMGMYAGQPRHGVASNNLILMGLKSSEDSFYFRCDFFEISPEAPAVQFDNVEATSSDAKRGLQTAYCGVAVYHGHTGYIYVRDTYLDEIELIPIEFQSNGNITLSISAKGIRRTILHGDYDDGATNEPSKIELQRIEPNGYKLWSLRDGKCVSFHGNTLVEAAAAISDTLPTIY